MTPDTRRRRVEKPARKTLYNGYRTYLWFDSLHDGLILPYAPGTIDILNLLIDPSQLYGGPDHRTDPTALRNDNPAGNWVIDSDL